MGKTRSGGLHDFDDSKDFVGDNLENKIGKSAKISWAKPWKPVEKKILKSLGRDLPQVYYCGRCNKKFASVYDKNTHQLECYKNNPLPEEMSNIKKSNNIFGHKIKL